jgi:WD40 repeat protein
MDADANPDQRHTNAISSVAFSPDGRVLISGSRDGKLRVWTMSPDGSPTFRPTGGAELGESINVVAVSGPGPNGPIVATAAGNRIRLWDFPSGRARGSWLTGHTQRIQGLAFSPNGNLLVSASFDGMLGQWNVETNEASGLLAPSGHTGVQDRVVSLSPDGKTLAAGGYDGVVIFLDLENRKLGAPLFGSGAVRSIGYSPDGRLLATGSSTGKLLFWDVAERRQSGETLNSHDGTIAGVAFSPDGKTLAAGGCARLPGSTSCNQPDLRLWDPATRKPLDAPKSGHTSWITSVAYSPDGKLLATGGADRAVVIHDLRAGTERTMTGFSDTVNAVAFSPDGQQLAAALSDGTLSLWSVTSGKRLGAPLTGHESRATTIGFSPDGRLLASGGADSRVILWDLSSMRPLSRAPLPAHTGEVKSVVFSRDGASLISSGRDGAIMLWDLEPRSWQERACSSAARDLTGDTAGEWKEYLFGAGLTYRPTCPELPVNVNAVWQVMARARTLIDAGERQAAGVIYRQAVEAALASNSAPLGNAVCWSGSLDGFAQVVLPACEAAVGRSPGDGWYLDSRGLARAMSGDREGALEDFEAYVVWSNGKDAYHQHLAEKRKIWIERLRAGERLEDVFDAASLEALRDE